jgi:hypothetical protein
MCAGESVRLHVQRLEVQVGLQGGAAVEDGDGLMVKHS